MIYYIPLTLLSAAALVLAPAAATPAEQLALEQLSKTAIVTPAGNICGTTEGFKTQAELTEVCGVTASIIWQGNPEAPESVEIELHEAPEETPAEAHVAPVETPVAAVHTPAATKLAPRITAPEKAPEEATVEAPQTLLLPVQPLVPSEETPAEAHVAPVETPVEVPVEAPEAIQAVQEYETVELNGYTFTFTADTHQLVNPPELGVPEEAPVPEPGKPSIGTASLTEVIHGYVFSFEGINRWTLTKITPPQQ